MIFLEISGLEINNFDFYKIIDVRDRDEYNKYHIIDSINVTYSDLLINPSIYLDKGKYYLIVCSYGLMSKKISRILNNMGYNTKSLQGGIKNYKKI